MIGGGAARGRVQQEYASALKAGIPILPVRATGGFAALAKPTADKASHLFGAVRATGKSVDSGDLAKSVLLAVKCYT